MIASQKMKELKQELKQELKKNRKSPKGEGDANGFNRIGKGNRREVD